MGTGLRFIPQLVSHEAKHTATTTTLVRNDRRASVQDAAQEVNSTDDDSHKSSSDDAEDDSDIGTGANVLINQAKRMMSKRTSLQIHNGELTKYLQADVAHTD